MADNAKLADLTTKLNIANQQIAALSARATTAEQNAAAAQQREAAAVAAKQTAEAALGTEQALRVAAEQQVVALQTQLDALPDQPTIVAAEAEMQQTLDTVAASTPASTPSAG